MSEKENNIKKKEAIISDGASRYIDMLNRTDLYNHALDMMNVDYDDVETIEKISSIIDDEILINRKNIIHQYGCIMEMIKFVNEMIEYPDSFDNITDDNDTTLDDYVKEISSQMGNIEEGSIKLESMIAAKEFANMLKYRAQNNIEIKDSVNNNLQDIIKCNNIIN